MFFFIFKKKIIKILMFFDKKKERIEAVIKKTRENELNFKINQNEYLNKIINERYADSLKKLSDTEKEY